MHGQRFQFGTAEVRRDVGGHGAARRGADLGRLANNAAWRPLPTDKGRPWTDDFSNPLSALSLESSWNWLQPANWWRSEKSQADLHKSMGVVLAKQGRLDEAIIQFQRVLKISPGYATVDGKLANLLDTRGRTREAIDHYQKAVQLDPRDAGARNNLAWLLATHPDATVRDGAQAIELARQAVQLTAGKVPAMLDTLAAAYAEAGRYREATETAERALQLAGPQGDPTLIQSVKARLTLYKAGIPFRQKPKVSASRPAR